MLHKQKINNAVKYGTRDRNPRRKYEYDYLRCSIPGRRGSDRVFFSNEAKAGLFILLLMMSIVPLFIALIIWGFS